jgi:elongation factor G
MGVEVTTSRLWKVAAERDIARLLFVNMLDRERADFYRTLESLKAAFGPHVVATEIPIGSEHEISGRHRPRRHARLRYPQGARAERNRGPDPRRARPRAEEYREKLMDEVAEVSDELMERYLEGSEISHEEIVDALQARHQPRLDLPRGLRRRDAQPRHQPPARGDRRGPALACRARRVRDR